MPGRPCPDQQANDSNTSPNEQGKQCRPRKNDKDYREKKSKGDTYPLQKTFVESWHWGFVGEAN
jgi:hypothetical protein